MFVLKKDPTVRWPTDIGIPQDGGKVQKVTVNVTYKLIDKDEYDSLKGNDIELLKAVVKDWDEKDFGSENEAGEKQPMPFNSENLSTLLKVAYVRTGLLGAFWEAQAGIEKN